jgi:hypothetical protein
MNVENIIEIDLTTKTITVLVEVWGKDEYGYCAVPCHNIDGHDGPCTISAEVL